MSILNHTDLSTDITSNIFNNGSQAITGLILQERLLNLADSAINKLGDTGIQGLLRYNSLFTISNQADLTHKKYVDDAITTATASLTQFLKLDGSNSPMTGNVNWGNFEITQINKISRGSNAYVQFPGSNNLNIFSLGTLNIQGEDTNVLANSGTLTLYAGPTGFNIFNGSYIEAVGDFKANNIISNGSGLLKDSGASTVLDFELRLLYDQGGNLTCNFQNISNGFGVTTNTKYAYLKTTNLTANRTFQFPDSSGTFLLDSRTININGDVQDLSANSTYRTSMADTGVLTYAGASTASATQINVGALTGWVIDNETVPGTPTKTFVNYAGASNVIVTTIGSGVASYLLINSAGTLVFQNTFPTSAQRKSMIYLSKIGHPSGSITTVGNEPDFITSPTSQLRDLTKYIGFVNRNVQASANGANLNLNLSAGTVYRNNGNFVTDKTIPDEITVASATVASFLYRTQTGAGGGFVTAIDPTTYDNAGTSTAIAGSSNQATNQRIYLVPGLGLIIQKGQTIYATITDAIAAVTTESFVVYSSLIDNAILIGVLTVTKGCTALNNSATARFFATDKFGQVSGATAGVSTATQQSAYNNSAVPQIIVTDTLGADTFRNGRAANTSTIMEWQNIAGTTTASVDGNGLFTMGSLSLLDTTYKVALDVSGANTIRLGNGFNSLSLPLSAIASNGSVTWSGFGDNGLTISTTGANSKNLRLSRVSTTSITATYKVLAIEGSTYNPTSSGAGSYSCISITDTINQTGTANQDILFVDVNPTLTNTLGNLYGVRSRIASGTNRWNIYADGTAQNKFSGIVNLDTSLALLDTTYKTALDVSTANTLRIANGFSTLSIAPSAVNLVSGTTVTFGGGMTWVQSGQASFQRGTVNNSTSNLAFVYNATYTSSGSGSLDLIKLNPTINNTAGTVTATLLNIQPTVTNLNTGGVLYGLRSQIATAPTGGGTAWNIYADGTAANGFGGDLKLLTAGNGFYVKEGTNATMGTATLVAGTVVVNTTKVTASSRIYLTTQSLGTVATAKAIAVTARTGGTSFTITSADNTDTSVIGWLIVEPS